MKAFGWADNQRCQLFAGYHGPPEGPVSAIALDPATLELGCAYLGFSVARQPDGTLDVVGGNANGQLGVGDHHPRLIPVKAKLTGVTQIAASGAHVLSKLVDGTAAYTGGNTWGTRGNGTSGEGGEKAGTPTPEVIAGLTDVEAVATGSGACGALHSAGTVSVWGSAKIAGDGHTYPTKSLAVAKPKLVPGLEGVKAIAIGGSGPNVHALALLHDGTVKQWGIKAACGTSSDLLAPTPVPGLANIVAIACGPTQSYALDAQGNLFAWGVNHRSQPGSMLWLPESVEEQAEPVVVLEGVRAIAAGYGFAGAILDTGELDMTGRNDAGQTLGHGLTEVKAIALGEHHGMAFSDAPAIEPPIVAVPIEGGLEVMWHSHETSRRWEVATRPAGIGAIWKGLGTPLPSAARSVRITGTAGSPLEVRVRSGTVYPARMVVGTPG